MAIYAVNVPVSSYLDTTLCAYHFLTFCAQFPLYFTNSTQFAASVVLEANTGSVNAASPSRFFSSSALFTPGHVGNYLAVRDPNNQENTAIVVITAYISSTEVQCNAPVANFSTTATGLSFRMFDINTLPNSNDYFVISNLPGQFPEWQALYIAEGGITSPMHFLLPTGGFDIPTENFLGASVGPVVQYDTMAQAFFVAEPSQGWYFLWNEDVGGVASNRSSVWVGTLGSTHAAGATGFPADATYAAIFGTFYPGVADNMYRYANKDYDGGAGDSDGSGAWPIEPCLRVSYNGATDILSNPSMSVNPRTGQSNDYDVVVGHPFPTLAIRGYQPGVRHCNDSIPNRTLLSGGSTYVIGNGVGVVWNGKPVV